MKRILLAISVVVVVAGCARDRESGMGAPQTVVGTERGAVGAEESAFAREACQTGVAMAEMGKLANLNTRNRELRAFAKRMAEDHARAEKELTRIFERKAIAPEPELAQPFQTSISHLADLKGGAFDRAFKQQVIADHEKAIALFEKQAQEGTDPDLKAFAQKHLPHLREHLETARGLPISTDTEGPPADSVNSVLQNPATRVNIPR